ncbi:MAG TPA: glycoside hydrolase family 15 protein [Gemmatimonadaceae bacterium]|nr:glycoside hydrolase family 15 protein [Gemmatimonadaceae bacterium]
MPQPDTSERSIGDYAIIGDCRSAALISREGSIDWLCWPRFDSPSLFAALLDPQRGGRFVVRPAVPFTAERRYIGETNVLETTFRTDGGVARLIDLMPVASEDEKRYELWPQHQILRRIACMEGEVPIEVICDPRPDYARTMPTLRTHGALGVYYEHRGTVLVLRSNMPLALSIDCSEACARATLRAGEHRDVSLVFSANEPAIIPPLGTEAEVKIETSLRWWNAWASRCTYDGPYRAAVVRSALTLKLLAYAPSGAVIAAPTTSLPEKIGGVRNWDYRYCWLRDTSLTLQALFDLGYLTEAESFLSWLLIATRLTWPELRVLYDVYGRTHLPERELDYLSGFQGSRPVRIGNDARQQLQLDIYGEVLDAVYQFVCRGGQLDRVIARRLVELGDTVCRRWREPDEGIWEVRGGRRHHTYSKAMCWVALDRLVKLQQQGHVDVSVPVDRFLAAQREIEQEIEQRGYNEHLGSYVSVFDGSDVDASLLQLARHSYVDPCSPRMRGTSGLIEARLGADGLLYRYRSHDDGLPPGEGAFGICSFWAVSVRALQGDVDGASRRFEQILSYANDVGLFAEEIDPESGEALGNFPQAFTHVGLIDAALTLASAERGTTRESDAANLSGAAVDEAGAAS